MNTFRSKLVAADVRGGLLGSINQPSVPHVGATGFGISRMHLVLDAVPWALVGWRATAQSQPLTFTRIFRAGRVAARSIRRPPAPSALCAAVALALRLAVRTHTSVRLSKAAASGKWPPSRTRPEARRQD